MNTIYESKNDYLIVNPAEYKTCPVWGYQVYFKHDCDKAHNQTRRVGLKMSVPHDKLPVLERKDN